MCLSFVQSLHVYGGFLSVGFDEWLHIWIYFLCLRHVHPSVDLIQSNPSLKWLFIVYFDCISRTWLWIRVFESEWAFAQTTQPRAHTQTRTHAHTHKKCSRSHSRLLFHIASCHESSLQVNELMINEPFLHTKYTIMTFCYYRYRPLNIIM